MTQKLRIRFVTFSMAALIIMQALIICFSAQRSYHNLVQKADTQISMIQATYPKEASVDARYFVATVKSGQENKLDMAHIRTIKKDQAKTYVQMVLDSGENEGFVDGFRYQIYRTADGLRIIFLSRSNNLDALKNTVLSQSLYSLAGLAVMLMLLICASVWVTRPVKRSYEKQQQFITSASHQLGTPLTVIRSSADILQMDDPENQWLQTIQQQVTYLTRMTQEMIALAKMDEQGGKICRIPFSLTDVVAAVAESFQSIAITEQKAFLLHIPPDMTCTGDENMIRHLLMILLDNAFKYCPENGQVSLAVTAEGKGVCIAVSNTANNVDPQEISAFFGRFYRGNSGKQGFGLGLSIAEAIVKSHKGTIEAELESKNRICINVTLK